MTLLLRRGNGDGVLLQAAAAVELVEGEWEGTWSWVLLHWSGVGDGLLDDWRWGEGAVLAPVMVGAQAVHLSPTASPPAPLAEAETVDLVAAVPTVAAVGADGLLP
jgi:hypothetical protein